MLVLRLCLLCLTLYKTVAIILVLFVDSVLNWRSLSLVLFKRQESHFFSLVGVRFFFVIAAQAVLDFSGTRL